ncbi:MAG: phage tail protein [Pseudomonadota bacterium]
MSDVVKAVTAAGFIALGVATGGVAFLGGTALAFTVSSSTFLVVGLGLAASLIAPRPGFGSDRAASQATLQLGEVPRQAAVGRVGLDGSLVDAFNHGGDDGTDWEVLVIALADHKCDALEGFFVDDTYHAFSSDGAVSGFNGQLEIYFKDGDWNQAALPYLTTNGPDWTSNDRGRGVCYVVAAYKIDDVEEENPIWTGGRPRFRWVLRGMRCYQARKDGSLVGGSGSHRRDDPATWEWTENLIDIRYNWVRGIYAGDQVSNPEHLLIGRGLSAIEAPPENVFARANLCDEVVDGEARYRIGAVISAAETFLQVEEDFAASCAGVIIQPEGSVEIDPGQAKSSVASFTDADLIVTSKLSFSDFLSDGSEDWVNTVVANFVDPDQRWTQRGAPPRRVQADITADKGPREATVGLPMVPFIKQAGRVAEVFRRLGRLWTRTTVTLPPRFAGIEEGDWVTWTSARHLSGGSRVFRVEAWGSDEGWKHTLQLREIAADVFSDTAAPTDSAQATQQDAPDALSAPGAAAWTLTGTAMSGTSGSIPALSITGAIDNSRASVIRVDYRLSGASTWTRHADVGRDTTAIMISGLADQTAYEVSIRYLVDGIPTPRRVLGPATTGALSDGGVPVDQATLDEIEARLDQIENDLDNQTP